MLSIIRHGRYSCQCPQEQPLAVRIINPRPGHDGGPVLRPDVVLMDLRMPHCDGVEATRQVRATDPNIKILMLTGKVQDSDRYWGEQQGANGYVAKPFTPDELINAVKRFA